MSNNINFDYKNLSPFKWFVLENFPFIEADFDALTEYQLFCKLGKEINKIIDSQNIVGEQAENLTNAFNNLKNYVDNYFDNLDVQDEINNKLNEMAESGKLAEIINQEIFGELNNRVLQNTNKITTLNNQVQNIQATVTTKMVVFGDSWSDLSVPESVWSTYAASQLRLNLHNYARNGAGFVMPTNNLIETQINNAQNDTTYDKNLVKYVILCGGINDYRNNVNFEILRQKIIDLYNDCKTIFPNAKILYVNNFQYPYSQNQSAFWYKLQYNLSSFGVNVLNQDGFFKKAFFVNNLFHLTKYGQKLFGSNIISALTGGQIKNDGVIIKLADSHGYIWLKRIDNMILYYIIIYNLSGTQDGATVNYVDEICWETNLKNTLIGATIAGYEQAVCEVKNTNLLIACNRGAKNPYFSGITALTVEL